MAVPVLQMHRGTQGAWQVHGAGPGANGEAQLWPPSWSERGGTDHRGVVRTLGRMHKEMMGGRAGQGLDAGGGEAGGGGGAALEPTGFSSQ